MVVTVARTPRSVTVTVSQCHSWFGSQLVVRSRSLSSAVVRWQGEERREEGGKKRWNEQHTTAGRPPRTRTRTRSHAQECTISQ